MTGDGARTALKASLDTLIAGLVAKAMPDWPVAADHCFLRIAYDNAVGDRWDIGVAAPAWRHLPLHQLATAVAILDRIDAEGLPLLVRLNATSLDHRRRHRQALKRHP